ncbi:54S ribosomal protein L19, mitochondrial [Tanacetum coccineum]
MSTKPTSTSLSTKIVDIAAPSQLTPPSLFLDELKVDGTGSIIVMIGRVWDVNATTSRYLSKDFVVSDSKGNMIHCTAKATIAHNFLRLKEGGIFFINNFVVRPNKDEFWVFRHDMFMLEFDGSTTIGKISANSVGFVRYTFQLVDFDDIELTNNKYMIDVSGYVTNVGIITYTKSGSKTLDFYLANQSTSSMVIYDNDDIPLLQELKIVTSLVEPNKEVMVVDYSQPREGTFKNLLLWAINHKNDVMIEDVRRKSGWNYPSCGGEKCRKSVSRQAGNFLCEACNRTVDYPVLRYRLEVVVANDTAHTVVVMFNEIATELLNCSADSLIEADDEVGNLGDVNQLERSCFALAFLKMELHKNEEAANAIEQIEEFTSKHSQHELDKHGPQDIYSKVTGNDKNGTAKMYGLGESVPKHKRWCHIKSVEDDSGLLTAIRNLIGTTHVMELKSYTHYKLARKPPVCTPSKPNEEKRKKRSEVEDSNTDEVLCSTKEPHEINADGPMDKKKRKMRIDEDSDST